MAQKIDIFTNISENNKPTLQTMDINACLKQYGFKLKIQFKGLEESFKQNTDESIKIGLYKIMTKLTHN